MKHTNCPTLLKEHIHITTYHIQKTYLVFLRYFCNKNIDVHDQVFAYLYGVALTKRVSACVIPMFATLHTLHGECWCPKKWKFHRKTGKRRYEEEYTFLLTKACLGLMCYLYTSVYACRNGISDTPIWNNVPRNKFHKEEETQNKGKRKENDICTTLLLIFPFQPS